MTGCSGYCSGIGATPRPSAFQAGHTPKLARADGQGRNWARILSTVLFGLAALQLRGDFTQPVSHAGSGVTVLYYGGTALFAAAWLAGAAAVWLLWRPASSAFFRSQGFTRALPRQV
jgi:hypothetical protein